MLVRVGDAKDIVNNGMRVFELAGTKVNVANASSDLYAFDDTCTHRGCSLANGKLDGTTVTCPCHGSQFDITSGAVLRGPAQQRVRSRECKSRGKTYLSSHKGGIQFEQLEHFGAGLAVRPGASFSNRSMKRAEVGMASIRMGDYFADALARNPE